MQAARDIRAELDAERLHYTIIRNLADNNDFNAVKYLYDRLNVIDAKAQGLLTRNGLLLTVVSIVGSVKLRADANALTFLAMAWEQWAFAIGFALLVTSTFMTFPIVFLRFDHVTKIAATALERMEKRCECRKTGRDRRSCVYDGGCGLADADRLASAINQPRGLRDYEDAFFAITIERQTLLRTAQRATIGASVLFFTLIGYVFWRAMDHLHFAALPTAVAAPADASAAVAWAADAAALRRAAA